MSIKSTYGISREVAIQVIISSLFKADSETLGSLLEGLPESYFRNYRVGLERDDEEMNIRTVEEFFSGK
jgi:hypothetical protein